VSHIHEGHEKTESQESVYDGWNPGEVGDIGFNDFFKKILRCIFFEVYGGTDSQGQ
jgi:hypothetical protein